LTGTGACQVSSQLWERQSRLQPIATIYSCTGQMWRGNAKARCNGILEANCEHFYPCVLNIHFVVVSEWMAQPNPSPCPWQMWQQQVASTSQG
jgi:hypothetical protein